MNSRGKYDKVFYELENKKYKVIVKKQKGMFWAKLYEKLPDNKIFYKFCFPPKNKIKEIKRIVAGSSYFNEQASISTTINRYASRQARDNCWWSKY